MGVHSGEENGAHILKMQKTVTEFTIPFGAQPGYRLEYENGYTFVFVPKKGGVFNISTWVKTGSIHETDTNNGISHFLEHLMFKGTDRFKVGEFDRAMESMGAIINAATWKDFTFYYVTGPKGEQNEQFAKALDMHADMMTGSVLPDAEIGPQYDPFDPDYDGPKRERSVVIEEIGMREDQPWTKVYNAINDLMYPVGHPYQRDVIGTREIIGNIPRESIQQYYQQWYNPSQFVTIVVGDFDLETLEPDVLKAFKVLEYPKTQRGDGASLDDVFPQPSQLIGKDAPREARVEGEVGTSFFMMGWHGPQPDDIKGNIALDIGAQVMAGARSSRMHQNLVEKPEKPKFTFVGAGQQQFRLGNVFFIQGNITEPDVDGALADVRSELVDYLSNNPITQDELTRTLKKMKAEFAETSETASGIADAIGESMTVAGSMEYYLNYLAVLETVTLDDVRSALLEYLCPEKMFTAMLLPQAVTEASPAGV